MKSLPPMTDTERFVGTRDLTRWPSRLGKGLVKIALRLAAWTSENTVLAAATVIGGAVVAGLTVVSAETYDAVTDNDGISALDRPVLDTAIALRTAANIKVINFFSALGGPLWMPIIATVVTFALAIAWKSRTPVVLMIIGVVGSLAMTTIGKELVGRVRPTLAEAVPPFESSPSFPSGHTLNSTVIAGILAYLIVRRLDSKRVSAIVIVLATVWTFFMGLSRVFLGHHWLSDVAMGWTLGLAWVAAVITAHRLFLTVKLRPALVSAAF